MNERITQHFGKCLCCPPQSYMSLKVKTPQSSVRSGHTKIKLILVFSSDSRLDGY